MEITLDIDKKLLLKNIEEILHFFNVKLIEYVSQVTNIRQAIKNGNTDINRQLNELKLSYNSGLSMFKVFHFGNETLLKELNQKCSDFFVSHLIVTGNMISRTDNVKNLFEVSYSSDISTFESYLGKFCKQLEEKHNSIYQKVSSTIIKTIPQKTIKNSIQNR